MLKMRLQSLLLSSTTCFLLAILLSFPDEYPLQRKLDVSSPNMNVYATHLK
jgi:hypothetical protein